MEKGELSIEAVAKEDRYILHNLMQFYIYEFSQYIQTIHLESNGLFMPFPLDSYWEDPHLHLFFLKREEELIGFAIVESETSSNPNTMQEFFIMAKHKRKGYGKKAAKKLFAMFPGNWEVAQIEKNLPAQSFWRSILYELTNGNVVEKYDEQGKSIQQFHTDSIKI